MFPSDMTNTGLSLGVEKIILALLLEYANTQVEISLMGRRHTNLKRKDKALFSLGRVIYLQRHHNLKWKAVKAHKEG